MRFSVFLAAAALVAPLLINAAPTGSPANNWTYGDVYSYALQKRGTDDPIAQLIARHVNGTDRQWDDVYQGDITISNGGTLTVRDTPHARLGKRDSNYVQAFPWVSNCDDSVSFTWTNVESPSTCYSYWEGGNLLRMYSVNYNTPYPLVFYRDSSSCNKDGTCEPIPDHNEACEASPDGRGW